MSRSVVRSLVCFGAFLVSAAGAADLPPQEAGSYTAVYKMTSRQRDDDPGAEWKYTADDTVTIAVLDKQARWDRKTAGSSDIVDSVAGTITYFGGKIPAGTARRARTTSPGIGWEFGYARVAKAAEKAPEVLGEATIAGQPCTRLKFVSEMYGDPEFCVAKNGVVLKFANASSNAEATYEAVSVDDKAPDASKFVTPAGLKVEERGERTRDVKIR